MQAVRAARRLAEREVGDLTPELPSWCLCGALLDRRRRAQRWSSTASGVWRRTMKRPAWAGTESRVRRETTTIVRKDAGTDQAAGWPSMAEAQPGEGEVARVQATAKPGVSPRHQMPSISRGAKVEAVTAKARPTVRATATSWAGSDSRRGTTTAIAAATRKAATPPSRYEPHRRPVTSCDSTPATAIVRPELVERKAAKAPAVTRPVSTAPTAPPTISDGSSRTSTSDLPSMSDGA